MPDSKFLTMKIHPKQPLSMPFVRNTKVVEPSSALAVLSVIRSTRLSTGKTFTRFTLYFFEEKKKGFFASPT